MRRNGGLLLALSSGHEATIICCPTESIVVALETLVNVSDLMLRSRVTIGEYSEIDAVLRS
jgi:hypothetical protein